MLQSPLSHLITPHHSDADDFQALQTSLDEIQQRFTSSLLHNVRFTPELYQLVTSEAERPNAPRPDLNALLAALQASRAARGASGPPPSAKSEELARKSQEQINLAHSEAERLRKAVAFCESRLADTSSAPS